MSTKVLLTGATGLLGFHILIEALQEGYSVRFTARSEEKAQFIHTHPVITKLDAGDRLSYVIVENASTPGAFDTALQGITRNLLSPALHCL